MDASLDMALVNDMLRRARGLPALKMKYEHFSHIQEESEFMALPPMTKNELASVGDDLRKVLQREDRHAYFFVSGGTISFPKLSFIPPDMFIRDITRLWRPLEGGDVLLNMFAPGKLWSAHYFYNALGASLTTVTIPLGNVEPEELEVWLKFAQLQAVSTLAATPTTLKEICRFCLQRGQVLDWLKKILWVGEPFDRELQRLTSQVMPRVELWGLYGSTETWVIGYNYPTCPLNVFHVLPYQYAEIGSQGELLVTNIHPDNLNILLRYQVGDRAIWERCSCGHDVPALKILDRSDDIIKFRGTLVNVTDIIHLAKEVEGVLGAQLVVLTASDTTERMELRVVLENEDKQALSRLREYTLSQSLDTKHIFSSDPDGFRVVVVPHLQNNPRTNKTALLLREEH